MRKHWLFNEVHSRWGHDLCLLFVLFFCAYVKEQENSKLLKGFGVPDGILNPCYRRESYPRS